MSTTDPPSFESFVAARGTAYFRFAYLLCGDHHLAEDLVQEVLARMHGRWRKLASIDQPDAYVRKAILHQFLSWRRRRSSSELVAETLPETQRSSAGYPERQAERDALWGQLATLPRQQRAVLVLRYYEDLDDPAIGSLLGCSPVTVRTHASRGLARLREPASKTAVQGGVR